MIADSSSVTQGGGAINDGAGTIGVASSISAASEDVVVDVDVERGAPPPGLGDAIDRAIGDAYNEVGDKISDEDEIDDDDDDDDDEVIKAKMKEITNKRIASSAAPMSPAQAEALFLRRATQCYACDSKEKKGFVAAANAKGFEDGSGNEEEELDAAAQLSSEEKTSEDWVNDDSEESLQKRHIAAAARPPPSSTAAVASSEGKRRSPGGSGEAVDEGEESPGIVAVHERAPGVRIGWRRRQEQQHQRRLRQREGTDAGIESGAGGERRRRSSVSATPVLRSSMARGRRNTRGSVMHERGGSNIAVQDGSNNSTRVSLAVASAIDDAEVIFEATEVRPDELPMPPEPLLKRRGVQALLCLVVILIGGVVALSLGLLSAHSGKNGTEPDDEVEEYAGGYCDSALATETEEEGEGSGESSYDSASATGGPTLLQRCRCGFEMPPTNRIGDYYSARYRDFKSAVYTLELSAQDSFGQEINDPCSSASILALLWLADEDTLIKSDFVPDDGSVDGQAPTPENAKPSQDPENAKPSQDQATVTFTQRYAMAVFYFATDGDGWGNSGALGAPSSVEDLTYRQRHLYGDNDGWLTPGLHECGWSGVCCGGLDKIQRLILEDNNLNGTIPIELGQLHDIKLIGLNRNQIRGGLPSTISNLRHLRALELNNNQMTSIPVELYDLQRLRLLSLHHNSISGPLNERLGRMKNLRDLSMKSNLLSGPILGDMRHLEHLELSSNQLNGTIPTQFGPALVHLELSDNSFSGEIPVGLMNFTRLGHLTLADNDLEGSIPSQLVNLERIEILSLIGNKKLNGTFPEEFCHNLVSRRMILLPCHLDCSCCLCNVSEAVELAGSASACF